MNLHTLKKCRHDVSSCFGAAEDAMLNTIDALLTEDRAHSFSERPWSPSMSEGLQDGVIDQDRLCEVGVRSMPPRLLETILRGGIDVSGMARPRSRTAEPT